MICWPAVGQHRLDAGDSGPVRRTNLRTVSVVFTPSSSASPLTGDVPESPRPTAGVDWATADHAVAIVDHEGEQTGRFPVTHDAAGLRALVRKLLAARVAECLPRVRVLGSTCTPDR
jgi:hypothetical protein